MWRVRLFSATGEAVTQVLVPLFVQMPAVIIWGARYFQLRDDRAYWEVTAAVAWTEQQLDEKGRGGLNEGAISDWE